MGEEHNHNQKLGENERAQLMFMQYVSLLANAGMQQLGKIVNPLTSKMEKDLEAARATIELLSMLKQKTKGNLSAEEEMIISNALANLQLNYADEISRGEKEGKKQENEAKSQALS